MWNEDLTLLLRTIEERFFYINPQLDIYDYTFPFAEIEYDIRTALRDSFEDGYAAGYEAGREDSD
jgi:hypothetical protein